MTIGAIIQARMSSKRLPGKVLLPLAGKPVLQYVIEAARRVGSVAGVVVATSTEASDDLVAAYCDAQGIKYFRGLLDNVAGRFLGALSEQGWDAAVRLSADSPLLDWRLIDEAVRYFGAGSPRGEALRGDFDLVTNVFPRSYPHGQSVEVVSAQAFRRAYPKFYSPEEFEHVTQYFYAHASEWRISALVFDRDLSGIQMALDASVDLQRLENLLLRLPRPLPDYTWLDLATQLEHVPV
jgi:spore coat polysaccharide biosynthesis protein SpsF